MDTVRVQWNGENEDEVFDFARPHVFRDFTMDELPMKLRLNDGVAVVAVGDWIVKTERGFAVEAGKKVGP